LDIGIRNLVKRNHVADMKKKTDMKRKTARMQSQKWTDSQRLFCASEQSKRDRSKGLVGMEQRERDSHTLK